MRMRLTRARLALIAAIVLIALAAAFAYFKGYTASLPNRQAPYTAPATPAAPVAYALSEVAHGLYVPWSIVFTSPNRLLVTERNGHLRIVEDGKLLDRSLADFAVPSGGEEGLMGLALDPEYADNKRVYACLAHGVKGDMHDKVISFVDGGDSIRDEKTIIDSIPAATNHAGCRLLFLPDNTLLVTTGEATNRQIAQDKNSLGGKILRINRDGSVPADNPFSGSPVWSFGHRNPQGLAYDAKNNILWETEHGPSGFDGPGGGDEINIIEKGLNYGWPLIHHKQKKDGLITPLLEFTPAVAPSAMLYYSGTLLPQFTGNLFFAGLKGEGVFRMTIDSKDPKQITAFEKMKDINVGRVREIMQAPDGSIYITTSNRDGRGKQRPGDDKIYRLAPQ